MIKNINRENAQNIIYLERRDQELPVVHKIGINSLSSTPLHASIKRVNCGNKFKGIIEVAELLEREPMVGVEVPLPRGLSHERVEKFLRRMSPLVFEKWSELEKLFEAYNGANFLEEPSVKQALALIREEIERAFATAAKLEGKRPFETYLKSWLEEIHVKGAYLMVRSSSVEDTEELPNAGGNLSESYIAPELSKVLISCGRVIASYFGENSLKNRLEASTNPFASPLVLSVLVQELIGETIGGSEKEEIPISLVLFTTEPDYSEKRFPVTKISCTYGHGEGVVKLENGVVTDTILVAPSSSVSSGFVEIYTKREKMSRLAPVRNESGKVELKTIKNSSTCVHSRSLDQKMVARLLELAKKVEAHHGVPMDMELVIKGDTIYVVQARRVVRNEAQPTYLSEEKIEKLSSNPVVANLYSEIIVPGRGSVEMITTPQEVLLASSLKEAEEAFKKGVHKLVVVGKEEPDNSHPIVNFSGKGVICLFHADLKEAQKFIQKMDESTQLLVCPQNGRLTLWKKEVKSESCIAKGYFSFPADIKPSLDLETKLSVSLRSGEVSKEIPQLLRALKEATVDKVALKALKELKRHPLVATLKERIQQLEEKIPEGEAFEVVMTLKKLQGAVKSAFSEVQASFESPQPRLQRLFHIKTLTTLLTNKVIGAESAYSVLHAESLTHYAEKVLAYRKKLPFSPQLESQLSIGENSVTEEGEEIWEKFLIDLEKEIHAGNLSQKDKENVQKFLGELARLNMLPSWFHLFFLPIISKQDLKSACLEMISGFNDFDAKLFIAMEETKGEMGQLMANLDSFGDPKTFAVSWPTLEQIGKCFSSEAFVEGMAMSSNLSQMIYLQMMREYVSLIDLAIKTMKSSPLFSNQEKLKLFNQMLVLNFQVLKTWFNQLDAAKCLKFEIEWDLKRYFTFIEKVWSCCDLGDERNLEASPQFSVQGACLSSLANYNRHAPKTQEDIFTLIHQNQLFALTLMTKLFSSVDNLLLPKLLKEGHEMLSNMSMSHLQLSAPYLSGIEIGFKELQLHYNLSLRNHSLIIRLTCNRLQPEVLVELQFFGQARNRWIDISRWIQALDHAEVHKLKQISSLTEQELVFQLIAANSMQYKVIGQELLQMIAYTQEFCQENVLKNLYLRMEKRDRSAKMGEWFFHHLSDTITMLQGGSFILDYLQTENGKKGAAQFCMLQETEREIETHVSNFLRLLDAFIICEEELDVFNLEIKIPFLKLIPSYMKQQRALAKCVEVLRRTINESSSQEIAKEWLNHFVIDEENSEALKCAATLYSVFLKKYGKKLDSELLVKAKNFALTLEKSQNEGAQLISAKLMEKLNKVNSPNRELSSLQKILNGLYK